MLKMLSYFQALIVFSIFELSLKAQEIFVKDDYCSLNCSAKGNPDVPNYLCNNRCRPDYYCHMEKLDAGRRQVVVDAMNFFRNSRAEEDYLPDITAVNYDLKLEYLAQCINNQVAGTGDICTRLPYWPQPIVKDIYFKNLTYYNSKVFLDIFDQIEIEKRMEYECDMQGERCDIMKKNNNKIGCSFNTRKYTASRKVEYYLMCVLPEPILPDDLWNDGPPASKCSAGEPPNDEYPNLCGKSFPAPRVSSYIAIWPEGGQSEEDYLASKDVADEVFVEEVEEEFIPGFTNKSKTPKNSTSASTRSEHCLLLSIYISSKSFFFSMYMFLSLTVYYINFGHKNTNN
ncbi:unnamed protein product [Brassicogethes aeneus]|uniref:Uncharacterized protein n=1 Tax=Brassicogethes aeneus TaxID=1431903 RepID=A0A9P0FKB4_BRAAE|nr:unnamed protein product [Brassicogethes aeneus]